MDESVLAAQTHAFVRQVTWQAAVLPFGATEPHNYHMPYGTDTLQVEEIGRRACGRAWESGARVALLPAMPFGVNTNHLAVPGGPRLHRPGRTGRQRRPPLGPVRRGRRRGGAVRLASRAATLTDAAPCGNRAVAVECRLVR
jgi:hypothetical protein